MRLGHYHRDHPLCRHHTVVPNRDLHRRASLPPTLWTVPRRWERCDRTHDSDGKSGAADSGSAAETFLGPLLAVEDTVIVSHNAELPRGFGHKVRLFRRRCECLWRVEHVSRTYKERILDYLWAVSPDYATNSQIQEATGIS